MNWFAKAYNAMRHVGRAPFFGGLLRRTRFDYRKEIGDCLDASVVTAPVLWIARALPEAVLSVERKNREGSEDQPGHPMLALIQRPNAYYGDIALWMATVVSFLIDGNAYWLIVRNGAGKPVELWYVPHWTMEPRYPTDGSVFISHYRYSPGGGEAQDIAPEDVIHFRHGINPRDIRRGLSPLDGTIREIFIDLESSNFVASLLRNMGVPGVVISPKQGIAVAPEDVQATKAYVSQAYGGDNRGGTLVLGAPTDVQSFGFNPQQLNMSEGRDVAEERVCACLGIPAAVVGFGAGLQQTKVGATMEELRKLAWNNGVLPFARMLADELQRSLLGQFATGARSSGDKVAWDTGSVLALQEDEDKRVDRFGKMLAQGAITLFEYRTALGLDADDSHRFYLRPIATIETPEGTSRKPPPPIEPKSGQKDRRASEGAIARGAAFALLLQRQAERLQEAYEKALVAFFDTLGMEAAGIAKPLLVAELGEDAPKEQKSDELIVAMILDKLGIPAWATDLRQTYQGQYGSIAEAGEAAWSDAGVGSALPDQVARAIVAAGGRRAGLIDLSGQTRTALFEALAKGRAAGEGAEALASRILSLVEAGPSSSPEIRARRIARTETKYAQNISTIERARAAGVTSFIVFDGRLGPGRSLITHMARNGSVVGIAEAEQMAADEHPNGTLSFAPHFEED